MTHVQSVATDMNDHTVTVEFDDEKLSIGEIVGVLNEAGYTVPRHSQVQ